jgi:hydrogenase nickel incorporation protein HypA/HybF
MYERSVAEGNLRSVIGWAEENNINSVKRVEVAIPSFTFLEADILKQAYDTLNKGTIAENSVSEVSFKDPIF